MKENAGKWMYHFPDSTDIWDSGDYFDTKEDAVKEARETAPQWAEDEGLDVAQFLETGHFEVGQLLTPIFSIDAEWVIENICEQVYEQCGEVSEDWLDVPTSRHTYGYNEEKANQWKAQIKDLDDSLNTALRSWLDRHNLNPIFCALDNIVEYPVKLT